MLENLGYEPTEDKYPNGSIFQTITGSAPGLNWTLNISINPRTKLLWAEMNFWPLEEGQKFPYDVLLEALERNHQLDTMRFVYLKGNRKLRLAGSLPVRNVKPVHENVTPFAVIGRWVTSGRPDAAMALARAGPAGGVPGSPIPVGGSVDGTIWTSIWLRS